MKEIVYGIYDYTEVIARFIDVTKPLDGPSGYPVEIMFSADNSTQPPFISVQIFEGAQKIAEGYVDQNTTLDAFLEGLDYLRGVVADCITANREKKTFAEVRGEKRQTQKTENDDLPF